MGASEISPCKGESVFDLHEEYVVCAYHDLSSSESTEDVDPASDSGGGALLSNKVISHPFLSVMQLTQQKHPLPVHAIQVKVNK